jgi:hypothetical protein
MHQIDSFSVLLHIEHVLVMSWYSFGWWPFLSKPSVSPQDTNSVDETIKENPNIEAAQLHNNDNQQISPLRRHGPTLIGYGSIAALAGLYGVPTVLGWVGFKATGVAVGSWAAWWQSTQVAPTVFATIQSASVTGAASALVTKIGLATVAGKAYIDAKIDSSRKDNTKDVKSKL